MSVAKPPLQSPSPEAQASDRLDSWKEIAIYLKRDERTVRRWEKDGLPVHRRPHKKKATIFAYKPEIDAWWINGSSRLEEKERILAAARCSRLPWLVGAALAFVLVVLAIALNADRLRDRFLGNARSFKVESLAVLPLENLSKDSDQEYFADGMTDELITDLAKIEAVKVISRGSVMRYKHIKKSLPEIARELNVDAVVEGTVLRFGDRVRITAQLIHAQTDRHLWANSYERDLRDVLVLQSDVAQAIAREIRIKVTPQEQRLLAAAPPVNPEAYELLLRAEYHHNEWTADGFSKARKYIEQAVTKDPNFALAHAWRGEIYFSLGWDGDLPPSEAYPIARTAALHALELDPSVPEAYMVLGYVRCTYDWNRIAAENDMRRAVDTGPNSAWAHWAHAWHLMLFERHDESIAEMRRARDLDPFNPLMSSGLTRILGLARRYNEALELGQSVIELYPNYPSTYAAMTEISEWSGKFDEAAAMYSKFRELTARGAPEPPPPRHIPNANAYWSWMLVVLKKDSARSQVPPLDLARTYAALGEKDQAFALLLKAVEQRAGELAFLRVSPSWDPLRDESRFQGLLSTVGLSGNLSEVSQFLGNSEMIHLVERRAFGTLRGADLHGSSRRPFGSEPKWVAHARARDFEAFVNLAQTKGPRTMLFPADAEIGFAFLLPYRKLGLDGVD